METEKERGRETETEKDGDRERWREGKLETKKYRHKGSENDTVES